MLQLDDRGLRIPAGARGAGAVFSEAKQIVAMFRKALVRTDSILDYLNWKT